MSEINGNLYTKIKNKLESEKDTYIKIRLEISKIFFGIVSSIYFLSYLCVIAGYQKDIMGNVLVGIYPLFVFGTLALIYDASMLQFSINSDSHGKFRIPMLVGLTIVFLAIMAFNYGLKF